MTFSNRRVRTRLLLAGAVLALSCACDHGYMDVPPKGSETVAYPARSEAAPSASGQKLDAPSPAAGQGGMIRGQLTLAAALKDKIPSGGTLFIIARQVGVDRGPPLATVRLPVGSFPMAFQLGQDNVMMQGMTFEGEVSLSARLDADGNAMTKGAGDITGVLAAPVTVGQQDVTLELNQVFNP